MPYRIFTTAHDEIVDAFDLLGWDAGLREHLSRVRENYGPASEIWDAEHRERFARDLAMFETALEATPGDAPLIFLIDNSGSMRGRKMAAVVNAMSAIGDRLDAAGLDFEVLGYTTRDWRGGRSRKDWVEAGRPQGPGRICDLRHLIYKAAGEPWRREALDLPFKEGFLKENVDGEALDWARGRALALGGARIVMVSDGVPVDVATLDANPATFLEDHLAEVAAEIAADPRIALSAALICDASGVAIGARPGHDMIMGVLARATAAALASGIEISAPVADAPDLAKTAPSADGPGL
jgi:cobalamin biosynthesis protein CobT